MLEKFGLIAKKFLFPTIIIIAGLLVVIKGMSADAETNIMQTRRLSIWWLSYLINGSNYFTLYFRNHQQNSSLSAYG